MGSFIACFQLINNNIIIITYLLYRVFQTKTQTHSRDRDKDQAGNLSDSWENGTIGRAVASNNSELDCLQRPALVIPAE